MATVDFRIKNLKAGDGTRATLAEVTGSIDATSIVQFQNVMDKLVEKGVRNLILDCSNIKYINSTGLGTLLKYVDTFESMDGHISFVRVPSKVMLVMEMLGFNALFNIVPDEAAALRQFAGKQAAPPPAVAEPQVVQARPAPIVPTITPISQPSVAQPIVAQPDAAPAPVIAQPQPQQPTIAPPSQAQPAAPQVAPPSPPPAPEPVHPASVPVEEPALSVGGFPASVGCSRCEVLLDVPAPGKYMCPRCQTLLSAGPGGQVRFFAQSDVQPMTAAVPALPELLDGLGVLVSGLARQRGFEAEGAGRFGQTVASVARRQAELAYGPDNASTLNLLVIPNGKFITVKISDHGKTLPAEADGAPLDTGLGELVRAFDSLVVRPNPAGGNLLTLTKTLSVQ